MFQVVKEGVLHFAPFTSIKQAIACVEVQKLITGEDWGIEGYDLSDFDVTIRTGDIIKAAMDLGESLECATILAREYNADH